MSEIRIRYSIELLEDTHTGSGAGRLGVVDDTQSRDRDGRPVIRPSTIRGLLREAGEELIETKRAANIHGFDANKEYRELEKLLGRAGDERGSAVFSSLRCRKKDDDDYFVVWVSTSRKVHDRGPQEGTLRQIEYARAGLVLNGEVQLPQDQKALFERLLQRVQAIGSGKTRGWGQVRLTIEENWKPNGLPRPTIPNGTAVRLRVMFQNVEPLNLAAVAVAGNFIDTQTYLPGGRLRGALLTWLSTHGRRKEADDLASSMKVGNGYYIPSEVVKERWQAAEVLPLPLSTKQPKGGANSEESSEIPWWARTTLHGDLFQDRERQSDQFGSDVKEHKRVKSEDYLVRRQGEAKWHRVRPSIGVHMRNTAPTDRRENNRPNPREAGLFSEGVIEEGQSFLSELWFTDSKAAEQFLTAAEGLLNGSWLRVGRGGRPVAITGIDVAPPEPEAKSSDTLTVTLTSDLIVRTPWLTFRTTLEPKELARLLGKETNAEFDGKPVVETEPIYGFNSATGLPRLPVLAIKRGSVFRYKGDVYELRAALVKCVNAGEWLGERTAEGFGRFVLDLDVHTREYWAQTEPNTIASPINVPHWEEVVLAKANDFLEKNKWLTKGGPTVSQWQWVRAEARSGQLNQLFTVLKQHSERLAGRGKWDKAEIGEIEKLVGSFPNSKEKQYFLDQLIQRIVAEKRRVKK